MPLIRAVAVFVAYSFVEGRLAKDTFRRTVQQVNPTLLGLSIFLGMKAFGVQGVIYGPLLVSTGTIIFQLLGQLSYDQGKQNLIFIEKTKKFVSG